MKIVTEERGKGLAMLDDAFCQFMGSGITLVSQAYAGNTETAAISEDAFRDMLAAWEDRREDAWTAGAVIGNIHYEWMAADLVLVRDQETGETVGLSVDDLRNALKLMIH